MFEKVFVIGSNKTGTTSLQRAFSDLGFKVAPQIIGERLTDEYILGKTTNLKKYIDRYQVFQDNPFSISGIHNFLYENYPNSKFILSIRNTPDDWYDSLLKYHTKLFSSNKKRPPTSIDLIKSNYISKSWIYRVMKFKYQTSDYDIYNKEKLINSYINHIQLITDFFSDKKEKLLIINLGEQKSFETFCNFLGKEYDGKKEFLKLNKS